VDGGLFKNNGKTAYLGAALGVYRDVAGTTNFGTTKINLSLSSIIRVGNYNTISIGLTGGWGQQSISPENLEWDAQFDNQAFDPTLPSLENFSYEKNSYLDYGVGVLWAYGLGSSTIASFDKFKAEIGGAYHHLSQPRIPSHVGEDDKLHSKIAFHADFQFSSLYSRLAFSPRTRVFVQGPAMEINVGMMFRYLVQEGSKYTRQKKGLAISAGSYYRVGDALSPSLEIEYAGFTIGYSYDVNVSGLTVASRGRGGSEFYGSSAKVVVLLKS